MSFDLEDNVWDNTPDDYTFSINRAGSGRVPVTDYSSIQAYGGYEQPNYPGGTNYPSAPKVPEKTDWGKFGNAWGAGVAGLQAVGSLGNLYLGYKQYEQGKKQFAQNKNVTNRNIQSQAKTINAEMNTYKENALRGSGKYRGNEKGLQEALATYSERYNVDGSRIG